MLNHKTIYDWLLQLFKKRTEELKKLEKDTSKEGDSND